jgi:hypothetical protein
MCATYAQLDRLFIGAMRQEKEADTKEYTDNPDRDDPKPNQVEQGAQ